MNIDIIKKDIVSYAKKYAVILLIIIFVFFGSAYFKTNSEKKLNNVNATLMSIEANIIKKRNEYEQSTSSLSDYEKIDKSKLPTEDGFVLGRDRLRAAVDDLSAMRKLYLLKKLNISMSEIKENTSLKTQSFSVYEGVLMIEFSGATDEYIFSLINDIKNLFPGFLRLKKMEIRKLSEIDDASISNFFTENSEGFVSGVIELDWFTLKSNNNSNSLKNLSKANGSK